MLFSQGLVLLKAARSQHHAPPDLNALNPTVTLHFNTRDVMPLGNQTDKARAKLDGYLSLEHRQIKPSDAG